MCLGFSQSRENSLGKLFLGRGDDITCIDHICDVMQMTMGMLRLMLDRHAGSSKALFLDLGGHQTTIGQAKRVNSGLDR